MGQGLHGREGKPISSGPGVHHRLDEPALKTPRLKPLPAPARRKFSAHRDLQAWFKSSIWEDDGTFLKALTALAFLVLLLLILFNPLPRSVGRNLALASATQGKLLVSQRQMAQVPIITAPRMTYLTNPVSEPLTQDQPSPLPTPAGGGILRKIAFSSNRGDGRYYQLYMIDANGNQLERLTEAQAFDRDPHFSYDGTRIAFSSNRTGTYQIFILELASRSVRQITFGSVDKTNPFWSPNNQKILYTLHVGGSAEIGIMNADGSNARKLTASSGQSHGYGFSPSGEFVSFETSVNNRNEICLLRLSDAEKIPLLGIDELTWCEDPVFSPVGNKLIFASNSLDRNIRQLYIYDLEWQKYYRLTDDDLDKDDPLFSPDGTKIAYIARWENAWNIFIMDADGKHARNLTKSYYDHTVPSWR